MWAPRLRHFVLQLALLAMFLLPAFMAAHEAHAQALQGPQAPLVSQPYQAQLKREAQRVWGLQAPVATMAAQMHQESRWRADARSPVGALGLAQFMPATAHWIGALDPELSTRAPLNPTWAVRALVVYDHWLYARIKLGEPDAPGAACQRWAYTLAAYNGGLGWVYKRQKLSPQPDVCLGATCEINPGITSASQRENAHYPVAIFRAQPLFTRWGAATCA